MTRRHKEHFQITKLAKHYNRKTDTFTYNITYETTTKTITPRTTKIAEAFGLGIDQTQKFTLYNNITLKIKPTDIILITGDSGSGKSTLLKALKKDLGEEAIDINTIPIEADKPIIETTGKTLQQALELLSKTGLNDAFLFLRTYTQLSDGQKYRYKLAKLAETRKQWWITDEFCSTLDRDTAKIVAFNIQKIARQNSKALIAATTHTDLLQDLNPSIHIHKRYGKEITINYYPNTLQKQCSLTKEMRIQKASSKDYKQLSQFHYRSTSLPTPRRIFKLTRKDELCGIIVYSHPPPLMFGRRRIWKGSFKQLQEQFSTISRVIIHPKYRAIGLGKKLVRETLWKAGSPYVETLAVMAKYNPFFEKAGMRKIAETKPSPSVQCAMQELHSLGFSSAMLGSLAYNVEEIGEVGRDAVLAVLEQFSRKDGGSLRKRVSCSGGNFQGHEEFLSIVSRFDVEGLAKCLRRISFLAQTKVYLFWKKSSR
jgi:ABC-type lipoprotein export system ATPase subunit